MNRPIVTSIIALMTFTGFESHAQQQTSAPAQKTVPRGEIRVVDKSPINWISITFNVFEHLMELDKDGQLVPRLATSWEWLDERTLEMKLRKGVKFHNGEVFDAEIVKLNWERNIRLRQPHSVGEYMNFAPGSRLEIVDDYTVRFHFSEVDGGVLPKIQTMHIGNRQFYDEQGWGEQHWCVVQAPGPWGTGPYKIVEGYSAPGKRSDRIVLEANTEYWDPQRYPRLKRIVFDNTLDQREALELVKQGEGRVDIVTGLSPLETLRVARSPFAKVIKSRGAFATVFGLINMRKKESPWRDVRLRRALNLAINREDLIRYGAKGNGIVTPALISPNQFGYPAELTAYPYDPVEARRLVAEAGYLDGLTVEMLATEDRTVQATVVGGMLEQAGFKVRQQILDEELFNQRIMIPFLKAPPEEQNWDIALTYMNDDMNFPPYLFHYELSLGGAWDWVEEETELQRLYEQIHSTVDRKKQAMLVQKMEGHVQENAYFLFFYNPIELYAVNKTVQFVPYITTSLVLAETRVTDDHWSVRKSVSISGD